METLSPRSRRVRALVTAVAGLLLLSGTAWGSDDWFPFGPFSMYAGVNGPNEDAPDARVEGVDTTGTLIILGERNSGVRRAEIEGQRDRYTRDPSVLREVVDAYQKRNPDAPRLVEIRVVMRWHEIRDGRVTGNMRDEILASWRVPA
jgi:hypothetical protein